MKIRLHKALCVCFWVCVCEACMHVHIYMSVLVTQSCLTLCNPTDCSPSGSSVHGILQTRILKWVAIPFSRRSSRPRVYCIADRFFTVSVTSSVQFSRSVVSNSLRPHESQHARPSCLSPTPGVYSDSHPSSPWCHPAISSSVVPFSSCQSLPASGSFPMSQLFEWGGQSTGVSASASVLPKKSQGWSPSEWTGWISLQSKGQSLRKPYIIYFSYTFVSSYITWISYIIRMLP